MTILARACHHELAEILSQEPRFIDVRAPVEFAAGSIPGAINAPLLTDAERERVGIRYKQRGGDAAIALGYELVTGPVREQRLESWIDALSTPLAPESSSKTWIYCWRGGLRSEIVQTWLREAGYEVPRVTGGFKALRHACMDALATAQSSFHWLVIAGRTGSGKTKLLNELSCSIDLEGAAHHRGSAFGAYPEPQPAPVTFENTLAVRALNHDSTLLVVEDESRTIGRLALPAGWFHRMQSAPLVLLEIDLATRVANIEAEYVTLPLGRGLAEGELLERFQNALNRIKKRLGGARHTSVSRALGRAFSGGDHATWIEQLLSWYYDPMYDYQLQEKLPRVVSRGNHEQAKAFVQSYLDRCSTRSA